MELIQVSLSSLQLHVYPTMLYKICLSYIWSKTYFHLQIHLSYMSTLSSACLVRVNMNVKVNFKIVCHEIFVKKTSIFNNLVVSLNICFFLYEAMIINRTPRYPCNSMSKRMKTRPRSASVFLSRLVGDDRSVFFFSKKKNDIKYEVWTVLNDTERIVTYSYEKLVLIL